MTGVCLVADGRVALARGGAEPTRCVVGRVIIWFVGETTTVQRISNRRACLPYSVIYRTLYCFLCWYRIDTGGDRSSSNSYGQKPSPNSLLVADPKSKWSITENLNFTQ